MSKKNPISWPAYTAGAAAGLGLLVGIVWISGFSNFFGYLSHARLLPMLAAVAVYAIAWCVRTVRIGSLTRFYGLDLRWPALFRYSVSCFALNTVLPAHLGDVALIGYLRAEAMPTGLAAALVLQLRILDAAVAAASAAFLLPVSLGASSPSWILASLTVPLLAVGAGALLMLLDRRRRVLLGLEKRAARLKAKPLRYTALRITEAAGGFHELLQSGRLVSKICLDTILLWCLEGLTAWFVAIALGFSLSPLLLFFALLVANLGKALPLTPGGLGVYEGLMAAVLTLGGMPYPQAASLAVCEHLLKKLFNLALGLPSTAVSGLSLPGLIQSLKKAAQTPETGR